MRIAVIGCVRFSDAMVQALAAGPEAEIVGIVTRAASAFNADFASWEGWGSRLGCPVLLADDGDQDAMGDWLRQCRPQAVFCVGWSRLLKRPVLDVPPLGVIGYHPALLPANRGRHPVVWALALGLAETGSTFFVMDEAADSGDILSQVRVPIADTDDANSLYTRLEDVARQQITDLVKALAEGKAVRRPQDASAANTWRKRGKPDGRIDWRMTGAGIRNLVRALTRPYVGAHCDWRGGAFKIWRAEHGPAASSNLEPGKVLAVEGRAVTVRCCDGSVTLIEHELEPLPQPGDYL